MESSQVSLVPDRLEAVLTRVCQAAVAAGRVPQDVAVMLAVKTQPVEAVLAGLAAMAQARSEQPVLLGQNRVQEMVGTGPALAAPDLPAHEMHLIGPLQSNKVNHTLAWADAVDSVDSLRLAQRLSAACERQGRDLDVHLEVNVSGEATKSGAQPEEALDLACAVAALPHLHLRGLMTIGLHSEDEGAVRAGYAALRSLSEAITTSGDVGTAGCTDLSMGMTNDLEWAIAEGATTVRVGRAVFGERR